MKIMYSPCHELAVSYAKLQQYKVYFKSRLYDILHEGCVEFTFGADCKVLYIKTVKFTLRADFKIFSIKAG